ncbi:hypothetical protein DSO57_1020776 [Entomophthora muscae]|uniref:Uncharacterized protein n=1 Tax=Entomophthora muscae TaxID=34485 RepID=A0ACC2TQU2_9FUNG|nr:hypothetical protein DSO57_1020776 [Entomophthora muscae]
MLIKKAFEKLIGKCVVVYLDNIIVFSQDQIMHLMSGYQEYCGAPAGEGGVEAGKGLPSHSPRSICWQGRVNQSHERKVKHSQELTTLARGIRSGGVEMVGLGVGGGSIGTK